MLLLLLPELLTAVVATAVLLLLCARPVRVEKYPAVAESR
jgi:hypothetical protein